MKTPKVLFLSDIHFINKDDESGVAYKIWNSALNAEATHDYLDLIINKILEIKPTHIIINGDISFSGEQLQYYCDVCEETSCKKCFYGSFIKPIKEGLPDSLRIILSFGNHDSNLGSLVSSDSSLEENKPTNEIDTFLNECLKTSADRKKCINTIFRLKDGSLRLNKKSVFVKVSHFYRSFFDKYIRDDMLELVNQGRIEEKGYFDSQGLFGVVHDIEYGIIINVLNSSWFSITDNHLKKYMDDIDPETSKIFKRSDGKLDRLLNLKSVSQQDILTGDFNSKYINSFGKYRRESFIVSISHFPLNWMSYDSLYASTSERDSISRQLKLSDVFYTSHNHLPSQMPNLISKDSMCLVFESSQILDYHHWYKGNEMKELYKTYGFTVMEFFHKDNDILFDNYSVLEEENKITQEKELKLVINPKHSGKKYNLIEKEIRTEAERILVKNNFLDIDAFKDILSVRNRLDSSGILSNICNVDRIVIHNIENLDSLEQFIERIVSYLLRESIKEGLLPDFIIREVIYKFDIEAKYNELIVLFVNRLINIIGQRTNHKSHIKIINVLLDMENL